jgi:hypothetical protein
MQENKLISLVSPGERHPLVTAVRVALNIAGDDVLDAPLAEVLRGLQHRLSIPAVGCINLATLDALAVAPPEW